jgi:hypothetical protein
LHVVYGEAAERLGLAKHGSAPSLDEMGA